ncbi:MAG: FecR domain-containing protein [Bacteroidota bacterium]
MKREDIEKIGSYINSTADSDERKYVESLFIEGENNLYLRNCLSKDWATLAEGKTGSAVDLSRQLDRIHHLIRKQENLRRKKPLQILIRIYIKIAAIILLPFLIAGGLTYSFISNRFMVSPDQEVISAIYAPWGSRVSFNLPDGTKGMLNSGSQLTYSLPFNTNRTIKLEGEAWLEVRPDEFHPFSINAGISEVKVLGTSFNISAYPTENYLEVVLGEGKLEFRGNENEKEVTLLPSERLVFKNGKVTKSLVDPEKYNAWTEGKLVFRGDPMCEVVRRIERWYNVKITIADKEIEKYSFRATFQDDKLEDVIRFLAMTSPITYIITPREIMSDGTIKKEEVTIYKKK